MTYLGYMFLKIRKKEENHYKSVIRRNNRYNSALTMGNGVGHPSFYFKFKILFCYISNTFVKTIIKDLIDFYLRHTFHKLHEYLTSFPESGKHSHNEPVKPFPQIGQCFNLKLGTT